MIVAGLVLAGLAALVHLLIFYLESIAWTGPRARAAFGMSAAEAESTRLMAFNQGFYNLFLAVLVLLGIVLTAADQRTAGLTLVLAGAGSMLAASLVLVASAPEKWSAALKQGAAPGLGVLLVALSLL